jgi:hypothetical protein
LFSYVRYNASIKDDDLETLPGPAIDAKRIAKLDAAHESDIEALVRVGQHAAGQVELAHFAGFLP